MKNQLFKILILVIIIFGGLGLYNVNKNYYAIYNINSINVTSENPLTSEKVKIEFGNSIYSLKRISDKVLLNNQKKYSLVYNGKSIKSIKNEYGENDFLIIYDNKYYYLFRQFKTNCNHQHKYNFHFYQKDKKIFIETEIIGIDAMKFEKEMLEIKLADKYLNNELLKNVNITNNRN